MIAYTQVETVIVYGAVVVAAAYVVWRLVPPIRRRGGSLPGRPATSGAAGCDVCNACKGCGTRGPVAPR